MKPKFSLFCALLGATYVAGASLALAAPAPAINAPALTAPTIVVSPTAGAAASNAAAPASGTAITGQVRDGTGGDKPLPNATVQLIRPGDNGAKKVLATTRTDAAGRYAFAAREWGADELLMANVPHQGYDYAAVAYDGGNKLQAVGMTVDPSKVDVSTYDTTNKNVPLQFQVHHLAIKSTDSGLNVVERIVVINPTDKTFFGHRHARRFGVAQSAQRR